MDFGGRRWEVGRLSCSVFGFSFGFGARCRDGCFGLFVGKRPRATAVSRGGGTGALFDGFGIARSVLECASPLTLLVGDFFGIDELFFLRFDPGRIFMLRFGLSAAREDAHPTCFRQFVRGFDFTRFVGFELIVVFVEFELGAAAPVEGVLEAGEFFGEGLDFCPAGIRVFDFLRGL